MRQLKLPLPSLSNACNAGYTERGGKQVTIMNKRNVKFIVLSPLIDFFRNHNWSQEVKPAIVNQQCLVYQFQCNLCDAGYVGYTRSHLHERVDGHKQKSSSICKHYFSEQNSDVSPFLSEQFHVLTKGSNKFDCLIKEMLFIRKLKPSLKVQADSIRAKVFT